MSGEQGEQKKQYNFPKRDELIEQIKDLDDQIEHVSLNLIKCDFNATEKDVEKTFPEFEFVKVKNYNPGSFEVIFELKIDAINFIRNCYDRKILARRFFIKLGRQHKEVVEDWACIGYAPKKFNQHKKGPHKPHNDRKHHDKKNEKKQQKGEEGQDKKEEQQQKSEVQKQKATKPKTKQANKSEAKNEDTKVQQPKQEDEGWIVPKKNKKR